MMVERNHSDVGLFAGFEGADQAIKSQGLCAAEGGGFKHFASGDETLGARTIASG